MVDVVLSADNLTVLGGPQELDVDLNIGADGKRGGIFFTGLGSPISLNVNQDFPSIPQIFDFYIDVDPNSATYLQVYQYVFKDGIVSWEYSFKINNQNFFVNEIVSFTNGSATANINVTDLGIGALPFDNLANSFASFNVQATISNINSEFAPDGVGLDHFPAALSVNVGDAFFDGTGFTDPAEFPLRLPISLEAIEYDGVSWSPIDNKDVVVYFNIGYASPNSIISNLAGGES